MFWTEPCVLTACILRLDKALVAGNSCTHCTGFSGRRLRCLGDSRWNLVGRSERLWGSLFARLETLCKKQFQEIRKAEGNYDFSGKTRCRNQNFHFIKRIYDSSIPTLSCLLKIFENFVEFLDIFISKYIIYQCEQFSSHRRQAVLQEQVWKDLDVC